MDWKSFNSRTRTFFLCLFFYLANTGLAQAQQLHHHEMEGFLGPYPMHREGSGTSWVSEASPMDGIHSQVGEWMTMIHGNATFVYDDQGGPRGDEKSFSQSMLMGMARRSVGNGAIGFRSMVTLEPLMGKDGYPLLFQTGETANGVDELVDRQHPHDLLMEIAGTYQYSFNKNNSVFIYAGYPGEPALGPAVFMHRFSGMSNPEPPISHHWMDSTHVTFGVATLGLIFHDFKIDSSIFTGREPDQDRWGFDEAKFDSYSWRVTYNPNENWSFQVSQGYIHSPEQLHPATNIRRTTASGMYHLSFGEHDWQTTFVWGQNNPNSGDTTNTYLLETALQLKNSHTFFGRAERAEKDELFESPDPLAGQTFAIYKISLGYVYDLQLFHHMKMGMGGLGSFYQFPSSLDSTYGENPMSFMLFGRVLLN